MHGVGVRRCSVWPDAGVDGAFAWAIVMIPCEIAWRFYNFLDMLQYGLLGSLGGSGGGGGGGRSS